LADVEKERFRADLFYRLNVISLHVPPLRERPEDIAPLAEHFLNGYRQRFDRPALEFSPAALHALENYRWPGNVRELRNCIERAVALSTGDRLTPEDLFLPAVAQKAPAAPASPEKFVTLDAMERQYILRVLEAMGRNRERTATALGITTRTLYRKLQEYASDMT
jgi:two-component system response regulator HydG